jgi:hypothetical protein
MRAMIHMTERPLQSRRYGGMPLGHLKGAALRRVLHEMMSEIQNSQAGDGHC